MATTTKLSVGYTAHIKDEGIILAADCDWILDVTVTLSGGAPEIEVVGVYADNDTGRNTNLMVHPSSKTSHIACDIASEAEADEWLIEKVLGRRRRHLSRPRQWGPGRTLRFQARAGGGVMANSGRRRVNYTPRMTDEEAYELLHPAIRKALQDGVNDWSAYGALRHSHKHGWKATVDWLRAGYGPTEHAAIADLIANEDAEDE